MKQLLRLYPDEWRDRYGEELEALLEQRSPSVLDSIDIVHGALDARLHALASPRSSPSARSSVAALLWWVALGILLGFGFVTVPSIGPSLLLLDMLVIAGSVLALGLAAVWAAGIGLGLWPSLILIHTIVTAGPLCQSAAAATASNGCADIPASYGSAVILALIPLAGLVAGMCIEARRCMPPPESAARS